MRNPRPHDFDPKIRNRQPDVVDMTGIVPIERKEPAPQQSQGEQDNVVSRYHGSMVAQPTQIPVFMGESSIIQMVRKAVKEFGKEAATHRFTQAEKKALTELVYTYRQQGLRTSENEITRIAINYLLHDYQVNGQESILHKSLQSLNG